jgi:hypothetical protein
MFSYTGEGGVEARHGLLWVSAHFSWLNLFSEKKKITLADA